MRLTDAERAMADGAEGRAAARAMDLLIRYGEALGAERLVEVTNVAGTWSVANPIVRDYAARGMDAVFSEFNLDSDEVVETPPAAVAACQLIGGLDARRPEVLGVAVHATCTPYQVGHVLLFGEHCAWMESSAVVYANAVLGARTNTEGRESTGAASITRRIPYWGLHIPENRAATHLVRAEIPVAGMRDWGLFGYWLGARIEDGVCALDGVPERPRPVELKHFGAAAASSGGLEMYHIPGVTLEAPDLAAAFRGRAPRETLRFGAAERRAAWEALNGRCTGEEVDFVMLGCPHTSLEQVQAVARLPEGRRVRDGVSLWVFTPRALGEVAERTGLAEVIRAAGGDGFRQAGARPAGDHRRRDPVRRRGSLRAGGADRPLRRSRAMILRGRAMHGGVVEGEAPVTRERISGWGGMDPRTGTIIEIGHELRGVCFAGRILVFPAAKGSSAWSHDVHLARLAGKAPAGLLVARVCTRPALGAAVLRVPALPAFHRDPLEAIRTGDRLRVDADAGIVEVLRG